MDKNQQVNGHEALVPEVVETSVIEQLTRGEVDMQVATAKRFPRSIQRFQQEARTMALKNPAVAASCFYVLPRGGKTIEGPSINMARIVAGSWGNMRCQTRIVNIGDKFITAQATSWDMEKNLLICNEVQRRITNSSGKRYNDDMIVMTGNAASSIALRNAIFNVVPMGYVDELLTQCKRIAATGGEGGLDGAKKKWLGEYKKLDITEDQILDLLEREGVADIDIDDVTKLQGLHTALSEGTTTLREIFPKQQPKDGVTKFGFKRRQQEQNGAKQHEKPPEQASVQDSPKKSVEPPPDPEPDPWVKHMDETREKSPENGQQDIEQAKEHNGKQTPNKRR